MSPSLPLPRGAALAAALGAAMVVAPLAAQQAPSGTFAVRCGKLLVGDGQQAITDAWLYVRDGKVERVSKTPPADDTPVVDASGKIVMPGIVAVDSDLAPARDSEYQVTPDAYAVDAFDFER